MNKLLAGLGLVGAYVGTFFVHSTTTTTIAGHRVDVIFSFYQPAALDNVKLVPRLVWTVIVWETITGVTGTVPSTVDSWGSKSEALAGAQAFLAGTTYPTPSLNGSTSATT